MYPRKRHLGVFFRASTQRESEREREREKKEKNRPHLNVTLWCSFLECCLNLARDSVPEKKILRYLITLLNRDMCLLTRFVYPKVSSVPQIMSITLISSFSSSFLKKKKKKNSLCHFSGEQVITQGGSVCACECGCAAGQGDSKASLF